MPAAGAGTFLDSLHIWLSPSLHATISIAVIPPALDAHCSIHSHGELLGIALLAQMSLPLRSNCMLIQEQGPLCMTSGAFYTLPRTGPGLDLFARVGAANAFPSSATTPTCDAFALQGKIWVVLQVELTGSSSDSSLSAVSCESQREQPNHRTS